MFQERLAEYKRFVSGSKAFDIGARLISPREAKRLFPLLNENTFRAAIYSSKDGVIDPTMLINALVKSAESNGCQVIGPLYPNGVRSAASPKLLLPRVPGDRRLPRDEHSSKGPCSE